MEKKRPWLTGRNVATAVFLLLANFLIITAVWLGIRFGTIDMTTILFQLKVPISGADPTNFYEIFILLFTIGPAATAAELGLFALANKIRSHRTEKEKKAAVTTWIVEHRRIIAAAFFVVSIFIIGYRLHIVKYVINQFSNSPIYDDEYVDPKAVAIKAPEKKRNLIYIYMESMEVTYADEVHGGAAGQNRIPEMTDIALNNICFTAAGSEKLNGPQAVVGTTWTMASLVAQTSGVPLTIPIGENAMGKKAYKTFLPGVYSIGQVLRDNGYELSYLIGSEKEFSGADIFLSTHGDYTMKDLNYYRNNGKLPKDYYVWWGFEDEKVYQFAQEELTELAAGDKPFAFTMMTMDTHFTNGLRCGLCPNEFSDQYSNVIACASLQLAGFLDWLAEQPYYEDTTIIVAGDHPTMDTKYTGKLTHMNKKYIRKTYCVVINSAVPYTLGKMRDFTVMDMYPTTLAAMGFTIPGDRLGIGVNLFSDQQTMLEKYGLEELNDLLESRSDFYDSLIYGNEEQN